MPRARRQLGCKVSLLFVRHAERRVAICGRVGRGGLSGSRIAIAAGRELNTALGPPPRGPRRELICPAINPISLERVWSFPEHADLS